MASKKRNGIWVVLSLFVFLLYFFAAARPIPRETVLSPLWVSSLDDASPIVMGQPAGGLVNMAIPFTLGERFGFVGTDGHFILNRERAAELYLGRNLWTEYEAVPASIEVRDIWGETVLEIEDPWGYPLLLDGRIFILGSGQNSLSELDFNGNIRWTYAFPAPLTSIDAAAGLIVTGSVDGVVEVLDNLGRQIFNFTPGHSRYEVILGVAISGDGLRIAVVSGVENQRFLLLERFGTGQFQVIYHEFLGDGFRRPVHVTFFHDDWWVAFEREGGLGIYETGARQSTFVPLEGEIISIDSGGGQGLFFALVSRYEADNEETDEAEDAAADAAGGGAAGGGAAGGAGENARLKELVGIKLPGILAIRAPFVSDDVFFGRSGSIVVAGGGDALIAFEVRRQ
ncbi:MAG: WD40 repeat domain-containing protein [Spirochaetes bacterium]|nr:WD40 repeat domain-containing protein [Spirochaetota bacterium]